jgi:hypothetical protein
MIIWFSSGLEVTWDIALLLELRSNMVLDSNWRTGGTCLLAFIFQTIKPINIILSFPTQITGPSDPTGTSIQEVGLSDKELKKTARNEERRIVWPNWNQDADAGVISRRNYCTYNEQKTWQISWIISPNTLLRDEETSHPE